MNWEVNENTLKNSVIVKLMLYVHYLISNFPATLYHLEFSLTKGSVNIVHKIIVRSYIDYK